MAANEELYQRLEQESITVGAFERFVERRLAKAREDGISIGEARGMAEGEARGEARGIFKAFSGLVKDGLLSVVEAAARAGLSESEFTARMRALQA